jgi:hypothetical protein
MAAPAIRKDIPETASSLPGISSVVQSENLPVRIAAPAEISGQAAPPADSAHENASVLSGPAEPLAGINPHAALIGNKPEIPGLSLRKGSNKNIPMSETDLIMAVNLAQINAARRKNRNNAWIMGGQMAPLYSYRNLNSDYLSDQDLNTLNNLENGVVAYAGYCLAYKPTKQLSVESNLLFEIQPEKPILKRLRLNSPSAIIMKQVQKMDPKPLSVTITNSTSTITSRNPGANFRK